MIYEYEACILKYIHSVCRNVKEATYAKDGDFFNSFSAIMKYPAFLYYREPTEYSFPKVFNFLSSELKESAFSPFEQVYIGRIYIEDVRQAMNIARDLRFYWSKNSYINVPWENDTVRVALRLLYIKIDEDRNGADKKGAKRFVEFSWKSTLFFDDIGKEQFQGLVQEVRIYLKSEGVEVYNNDNLIAKIK